MVPYQILFLFQTILGAHRHLPMENSSQSLFPFMTLKNEPDQIRDQTHVSFARVMPTP